MLSAMAEFPAIVYMVRTAYNAEDGLEEEISVRLYQRAADHWHPIDGCLLPDSG